MKDHYFQWQSFREDILWEFHVNELLEINLYLIEALYDKLKKAQTTSREKSQANIRSKFLSSLKCTEIIFNKSVDLGVSQKQIQAAFILSKMTVAAENDQGDEYF